MKKSNPFIKVCKALDIDPESIPPIMSFEVACEWLKRKPDLPIVKHLPKQLQAYVLADYKLITITEALNLDVKTRKPWYPDYTDMSEYKYEPWFEVKADKKRPSGFGFSYSSFGYLVHVCGCRLAPLL